MKKRKKGQVTDEEVAKHFDRDSDAEEWATSKPVKVSFKRPIKHMISIRLELDLYRKIRRIADAKSVPYQTMMRSWLVEKVEEELPSLENSYLYASGVLMVSDRRA